MTLFKQLLHNRVGRDFVVGDLHGQYDLLKQALDQVEFDTHRDRLIAVGDLVNRGPNSLQTLRLLSEPWFHAVAGNHEWRLSQYGQALTERTLDDESMAYLGMIGADWLLGPYRQLNDDKWADLITEVLNLIRQLPLLIQIGHGHNAVGVVHAQLPNQDWNVNVSRLERLRKQPFWSHVEPLDPHISHMLHGRAQLRAARTGTDEVQAVRGIDWVIAGHSVVEQPMRSGNRLWIDTGAYRSEEGHGLTLVQLGQEPSLSTHYSDRRTVRWPQMPAQSPRHSLQPQV